ncbi:MAG: hypothetical protein ABL958_21640, partial [Bdellovibrionia bacterium]
VSVRPALTYQVRLLAGLSPVSGYKWDVERNMIRDFKVNEAGLGAAPFVLAKGLSVYFEQYPYLCTEQLVSRAMAALMLKPYPGIRFKTSADDIFRDTIMTLRSRQTDDGGFALYRPAHGAEMWVTTHVIQYLLIAKERGMNVPADLLKKSMDYLESTEFRRMSNQWDARNMAISLYLSALNGKVFGRELKDLHQVTKKNFPKFLTNDIGGAYMAATYKLYKQNAEAEELIRRFDQDIKPSYSYYWYAPWVDHSMTLILVARHFPEQLARFWNDKEVQYFLKPLAQGDFTSYTGIHALLAFEALAKHGDTPEFINNRGIDEVDANGKVTPLKLEPKAMAYADFSDGAKKLQFRVPEKLPAFYYIMQSGFDSGMPSAEKKAGIEVGREYVDVKSGNPVKSVKIGEEIRVRLRVRATGNTQVAQVAIVDLYPGGFEPVLKGEEEFSPPPANDDLPQKDESYEGEGDYEGEIPPPGDDYEGEGGERAQFDIFKWLLPAQAHADGLSSFVPFETDQREDRMVLYGDFSPELHEYEYKLKAVNKGTFVVPPP